MSLGVLIRISPIIRSESATFLAAIEKDARLLVAGQSRQSDIGPNSHFQNQPLLFAVFRDQGHAGIDRASATRSNQACWPATLTWPDNGGSIPKIVGQHFSPPGTDQSGDADHLAGRNMKVQLMCGPRLRPQTLDLQNGLTNFVIDSGVVL